MGWEGGGREVGGRWGGEGVFEVCGGWEGGVRAVTSTVCGSRKVAYAL